MSQYNAFTELKYKKPAPQEVKTKNTKKINQTNQSKKKKPTKPIPLKTTPVIKQKTQQTITEMLQTSKNQDNTKTKISASPEKPPPLKPTIKPPKLIYRPEGEEKCNKPSLEPNHDVNQTKPNLDIKQVKPVKHENQNQETQIELKPTQGSIQKLLNLPAYNDTTKRKPNQETTNKPKPAQTLKPVKKVKPTVLKKSDLQVFLEKKRKERELKQAMNLEVVTNPSPSILCDNATLSRPPDSHLKNAPGEIGTDEKIIIERDQGSSAQNGEIQNLSGDLLLAQCRNNLGEQPIV